ncbi:hypothetical protein ACQ859_19580 [Roseateles chitinivorans]|uniref:hypothetical protein n=1 Tax=Roseateles chitinivorans TaxID=2917965 RepID=UPI003D674039
MLPEFEPETCKFVPLIPDRDDEPFWFYVDEVLEKYGDFSDLELSALGREREGPWEEMRNAKVAVMDDEVIRKHFARKMPDATID